jgi:hypothetical protein
LTLHAGRAYAGCVPLPETIPVRYTEEEAGDISIRAVKRQTFRIRELVDMILRVTGRDEPRVHQILRSGTVVYHFYRYWWQGFDADGASLSALLAEFPADEPQRPFREADCKTILMDPAAAGRRAIEIEQGESGRKPLFAARSFWDCLLAYAKSPRVSYANYSFDRTGDLYQVSLEPEHRVALAKDATRLAARPVRAKLEIAGEIAKLTYICPRSK